MVRLSHLDAHLVSDSSAPPHKHTASTAPLMIWIDRQDVQHCPIKAKNSRGVSL